jgi:hypothetical protein
MGRALTVERNGADGRSATPQRGTDNGAGASRAPAPAPPAGGDILLRALAWSTADLDPATAAHHRAEALGSPAWAARHAYALGYWEGGAAVEALVAADRAARGRRPTGARPLWRQIAARLARWRRGDGRGGAA